MRGKSQQTQPVYLDITRVVMELILLSGHIQVSYRLNLKERSCCSPV